MPHFGLMDADALGPEKAALMRARLHIRGGLRRLRQGKISYGIITLYDALVHAMQWYLEAPELRGSLDIRQDDDLNDDSAVYRVLVRSGALDGAFDYEAFYSLVDDALALRLEEGFDYGRTLGELESVFTQLGVMPFDESELTVEDPSTY